MKKQIMSIAAAAALFTTGAMAFDALTGGEIVTDANGIIVKSSYLTSNATIPNPLAPSLTQKGDALIYPLYTTADGYESEVVVRNTSANAIVAKVVFYAASDSRELRDFNIYLSGYDVFRFNITADGNTSRSHITSTDGSIIKNSALERTVDIYEGGKVDDYHFLKFASESNEFNTTLSLNKGYIAIFGMVQSDAYKGTSNEDTIALAFHDRHADLYAGYAKLLDDKRGSDWRKYRLQNSDGSTALDPKYMIGSMFTDKGITIAPNLVVDDKTTWKKGTKTLEAEFRGVDNVLTGHISLKNTKQVNDLLLPAKAINNFSDGDNVVLWTPGEYASIADRCIQGNSYDEGCVKDDAKKFLVDTAVYTYAQNGTSNSEDNRVYITQPYKRTLLQIANDKTMLGYTFNKTYSTNAVETGNNSFFTAKATVYDENEQTRGKVDTTGSSAVDAGVSGEDTGTPDEEPTPNKYRNEVEMIGSDAFENHAENKDKFGAGNGFATFNVGVPAIITQMVASQVGTSAETNWVYSDTK